MSSYTTELRYICESLIELDKSVGFNNTLSTIEQARPLLFDFNYPIFNVDYKPILETNFILHFYTREIGLETFGLWKLKLMSMFRIKMPYYNKLYEAINTEFNPLYDINIEKTFMGDIKASIKQDLISNEKINTLTTQERKSVNDETQNNDSTNWDLYQDTPQGALVGIENQNYLTNARKQTDDSSTTTNSTNNTTGNDNTSSTANRDNRTTGETTNSENRIETIVGKQNNKSYGETLFELKNKLFSVDESLFNDMDSLFMQYYGGFYF